jgi:hypothetical protein
MITIATGGGGELMLFLAIQTSSMTWSVLATGGIPQNVSGFSRETEWQGHAQPTYC